MNNKYGINISYSTGNSFGSEDLTELFDYTWEDQSIVIQNLEIIRQHFKFYREINDYRYISGRKSLSKEEIIEKYKKKPWFKYNDEDCKYGYYEHCLYLKTDKNEWFRTGAFWCGYFETLYGAELIQINNNFDSFDTSEDMVDRDYLFS